MQLTQTAEYALRAMAHLASLDPGEGARAKDIAAADGIPAHYLSKLLRKLVIAGLLTSRRGHGGGFVLARPPGEIRFIEILRAVDYAIEPDHCSFGWGQCNPAKPCPLHGPWSRMSVAFMSWAETTTLEDVSSFSETPT